MCEKKLTIYRKRRKKKKDISAVVCIESEAYLKAEALCEETGLPMRKMISLLVNFACDNAEVKDAPDVLEDFLKNG